MTANSLQYGIARANYPKSVDISATPAIPNILRDTLRGVKMNCKNQKCPLLAVSVIKLTKGKYAIVDKTTHGVLNGKKWYAQLARNTIYANRRENKQKDPKQSMVSMHRVVAKAKKGEFVDHINGNGIDNRKANLRICTMSENIANSRKFLTGSSKYKGVCLHTYNKNWIALIKINRKSIHIGCFDDEIDAARAYDQKASELYGEFACLNFIESEVDK